LGDSHCELSGHTGDAAKREKNYHPKFDVKGPLITAKHGTSRQCDQIGDLLPFGQVVTLCVLNFRPNFRVIWHFTFGLKWAVRWYWLSGPRPKCIRHI